MRIYWGFGTTFIFPSCVKSLYLDQVLPPLLGVGSKINSLDLICSAGYVGNFDGSNWKDFFESLNNCDYVSSLSLSRFDYMSEVTFVKDSENTDDNLVYFDDSKVNILSLECSAKGSGNILNGLSNINNLTITADRGMTDLQLLGKLTNLTSLKITGSDLKNLNWINTLQSLTTLNITSATNLLNLDGIESLNSLSSLTVTDSSVSSCVPLKNMVNLTYLDLRNNVIGQMSDDNGVSRQNLDILYQLNPNVERTDGRKGRLTALYLQGNNGLKRNNRKSRYFEINME